MAQWSDRWTDAELYALEGRIRDRYTEAAQQIGHVVDQFYNGTEYTDADGNRQRGRSLAQKDADYQALVSAGKRTEDEYRQWRLNQMTRGSRYAAMQQRVANILTDTNTEAIRIVNGETSGVYAQNRNYEAYHIEQAMGVRQFTVVDAHTVDRLIKDEPDIMPYYPPERAVQRGIDLAYGKSQITKRITSGILSGSSVPDIARSLRDGISTMGYVSSVRAARTAITSAQNGGRMAAYKEAEEMGLEFKRQWVATLDARTRHEHQLLDGQQAKNGEYFRVGRDSIEYPGDPRAPGYLVYNCRCTLKAVFPNQQQGRRIARSGDGTGAWEEVEQQTYKQWAESKGAVYDDSSKTVSVGTYQKTAEQVREDEVRRQRDAWKKTVMESGSVNGMTDEQKKEFETILDGMTDEYLEMYAGMTAIHGANNYKYVAKRGPSAFYDPAKHAVYMGIDKNHWERSMGRSWSVGAFKTKFHEEMHQLDHVIGRMMFGREYQVVSAGITDYFIDATKYGTILNKAMENDIIKFINSSIDYRNRYFSLTGDDTIKHISNLGRISSGAKESFYQYMYGLTVSAANSDKYKASVTAFTDAVGLFTRSKINPYSEGYWGHDAKYQRETGQNGAFSEGFAEIGAYIVSNDQECLSALRQLMPETISAYETIMHEMATFVRNNELRY